MVHDVYSFECDMIHDSFECDMVHDVCSTERCVHDAFTIETCDMILSHLFISGVVSESA